MAPVPIRSFQSSIIYFILVFLLSLSFLFSPTVAVSCITDFAPNPADCSTYFQCDQGQFVQRPCPAGLEWNPKKNTCDWSAEAGCFHNSKQGGSAQPLALQPNPYESNRMNTPKSNASISQSEFNCAAATKGGHPATSYYYGFIQSLPLAKIQTKEEAAKFLAHEVWETVGFQFVREQYCIGNMAACESAYPNTQGKPGKVYYGRGMLQLTWDYNYAAASKFLFNDDRLIQNPDMVADDPAVGCATAAWFWRTYVHLVATTFGETLKAINGPLECEGGPNGQNRILRFNHYKNVLTCLNLPEPIESDGYCHV